MGEQRTASRDLGKKKLHVGSICASQVRHPAENKRACSERSLPHGRVRDREGAIANTRGAFGPRKKEKAPSGFSPLGADFSGGELSGVLLRSEPELDERAIRQVDVKRVRRWRV